MENCVPKDTVAKMCLQNQCYAAGTAAMRTKANCVDPAICDTPILLLFFTSFCQGGFKVGRGCATAHSGTGFALHKRQAPKQNNEETSGSDESTKAWVVMGRQPMAPSWVEDGDKRKTAGVLRGLGIQSLWARQQAGG